MAGTIVFMPHTFYALRNSEKEEENAGDGEYSEDEEKVEDIEDAERDYPAPIEYNFNCENAVKNPIFCVNYSSQSLKEIEQNATDIT